MRLHEQVDELRAELKKALRKINRLERQMTDIKKSVADVEAAEAALEEREKAHDARDAAQTQALRDIATVLQKEIDDLKAGQKDTDEAAASLDALKGRIEAFDPDPSTPDTPIIVDEGTPPAGSGGSGDGSSQPVDNGTPV